MDIRKKWAGLSKEQREYLLKKLNLTDTVRQEEENEQTPKQMENEKPDVKEYYPISAAQKRIYLAQQVDTTKISYNIPSISLVVGQISRDKVQHAITELGKKHEILRTSFHTINGELVQKIHPAEEVIYPIEYRQYDGVFQREIEKEDIDKLMNSFMKPFDLSVAPLIRVCIVTDREGRSALITDVHHIIADGTSINILIDDFIKAYQGEVLTPLAIQYKDYAKWHNQLLESNSLKEQRDFWVSQFEDDVPVLELPYDFPRPKEKLFSGERKIFHIEKKYMDMVDKLQKKYHTTLFMTLLSLFNILLSKYSGQEDIVIGTPIAGRHYKNLNQMIGMFANTMALRNFPQSEKSVGEFMREVAERTVKSYDNQDYPFDDLVAQAKVKRDAGRNPVFDVMFILQNMPGARMQLDGLEFIPQEWYDQTSKFDILFEAFQNEEEILLRIEYAKHLFVPETIDRMCESLISIIVQASEHDQIKIGDIEVISSSEKSKILNEFNRTELYYDRNVCMHQLFERQAEKTPDRIALKMRECSMTYRELNEKANRLAGILLKEKVKMVGILLKPSFDVVISMLAVWKAGAAYMLIDGDIPEARIKFMVQDADIDLVITKEDIGRKTDLGCRLFYLDDKKYEAGEKENLQLDYRSDSLAYIVYTSGSTGQPKGVLIEHRTLSNLFAAFTDRMEFIENKTIIALSTVSFDVFIIETILPLSRGMHVVIADETEKNNMQALNQLMYENRVEMLQCTPTRLEMFLHSGSELKGIEQLKDILVGGEILSAGLVERLQRITNAKIHNLYGLTEITVWSMEKTVPDKNDINIGTPIANTRVYILDRSHHMQPIGVIGELCLAGDGMPRGYHKREELNRDKFAQDPFYPNEKIFYTGDLARWTEKGEVELYGRRDFQVKIRGNRIEIGEIENILKQCEGIEEAAVIPKREEETIRLYAYLKGVSQQNISKIKEHLEQTLPKYMIPSFFIEIPEFPHTISGKINRTALAQMKGNVQKEEVYQSPETDTEKRICEIWKQVLGIDNIGRNDDFFDVGGNSLLGIKLQMELLKHNLWQEGKNLYQYKTIAEQAALCENLQQPEMDEKDELRDEKVLTGITPFNSYCLFDDGLYNMILHTARFFSYDIESILAETDFVLYYTDNGLNLERKQRKGFEEIQDRIGIKVEEEKINDPILQMISRNIQKGRPIILPVKRDGSECSDTDYLLIYGYHNEKSCVYAIEKDESKNTYRKAEISYESLQKIDREGQPGDKLFVIRKEDSDAKTAAEPEERPDAEFSREREEGNKKQLLIFMKNILTAAASKEKFLENCEKWIKSFNMILDTWKLEMIRAEYEAKRETDQYRQLYTLKSYFGDIRNELVKYNMLKKPDDAEYRDFINKLDQGYRYLEQYGMCLNKGGKTDDEN